MELTELFDVMRGKENFTRGERGATDEEIGQFAAKLGVELPDSYVTFLREFGYAWWFGGAVYGISDDEDFDALTYTLEAREEELPADFEPLPRDGVIIESYGGGGHYFLYAKDSPQGGAVALLLDETYGRPDSVWESFEDFLRFLLGV